MGLQPHESANPLKGFSPGLSHHVGKTFLEAREPSRAEIKRLPINRRRRTETNCGSLRPTERATVGLALNQSS